MQGGIGVPFIARWPGRIAAGKIDDTTPITAVDLLPTFCAIARADLPQGYTPDGLDQSAALFGKPSSLRTKPIYWQWNFASQRGENWPALAVREGAWKLLQGKNLQQVELFRFPQDRREKHNLRTDQPAQVERLKTLLDEWTATLPAKPNQDCFSSERSDR